MLEAVAGGVLLCFAESTMWDLPIQLRKCFATSAVWFCSAFGAVKTWVLCVCLGRKVRKQALLAFTIKHAGRRTHTRRPNCYPAVTLLLLLLPSPVTPSAF
jgi:hypothetical protein